MARDNKNEHLLTIEVNGEFYVLADDSGNVTADAQAAKEAVIGFLIASKTVDVTIYFPYDDETTPVSYTFNFLAE